VQYRRSGCRTQDIEIEGGDAMSAAKVRSVAALLLVMVHVQGIQYDTCNSIPTSFSPKCDLGKSYTLDDYQGKRFSACRIKECPTGIMKSYDPFLATVVPEPFVTVNHIANFTCRSAYVRQQ
jgi:hypothetical protein